MKTAQDLHKVADDTYPIRMDKINDLVARCETAAKEGKYRIEVATELFPTNLNENERTYLHTFGFNFMTIPMFYSIYSDKITTFITW